MASAKSPEEQAREEIDRQLAEAGWIVQDRDAVNLSAGRGVAIREFKMADGGFADYLLYVDKQAAIRAFRCARACLNAPDLNHPTRSVPPVGASKSPKKLLRMLSRR